MNPDEIVEEINEHVMAELLVMANHLKEHFLVWFTTGINGIDLYLRDPKGYLIEIRYQVKVVNLNESDSTASALPTDVP